MLHLELSDENPPVFVGKKTVAPFFGVGTLLLKLIGLMNGNMAFFCTFPLTHTIKTRVIGGQGTILARIRCAFSILYVSVDHFNTGD